MPSLNLLSGGDSYPGWNTWSEASLSLSSSWVMESTKDFVASGAKVVMDSHKFCSRPLASQTMSTTRLKFRNRRYLRLVFYSLVMAPS